MDVLNIKERLRNIILEETRVLDALIHSLANADLSIDADGAEIRDAIILMIQGLGVSLHSVLRLTENIDLSIRDCFGIARTASELSVNVAYITCSSADVARRAVRHALQKTYRDQERSGSVGGTAISVSAKRIEPSSNIPGLDAALAEFTDAKGREIRDWVPENIDKRVATVSAYSEKAGTALSGSVFAIYRHSSELLHGTYFGIVYYWGGERRARTKEEFADLWLTQHFITIFTAIFFGALGVVATCAKRFGFPELEAKQKKLADETAELIEQLSAQYPSDREG